MEPETAVVAGVGPGLGASIVEKLTEEDVDVAMFARTTQYTRELENEVEGSPGDAAAFEVDITSTEDVSRGFEDVRDRFGSVDVLVNNASDAPWQDMDSLEPRGFERAWRVDAYGSYLCTEHAVEDMKTGDGGVVLFTGATSSIRGNPEAVGFSSAKYAKRGLAESLARDLGDDGIHVAHFVIDGKIDTPKVRERYPEVSSEELLDPAEIAETYWHVIQQDRSAWTLELDLRPNVEEF